ncbi:unnamed protein product, partial [Allacma fusca]
AEIFFCDVGIKTVVSSVSALTGVKMSQMCCTCS